MIQLRRQHRCLNIDDSRGGMRLGLRKVVHLRPWQECLDQAPDQQAHRHHNNGNASTNGKQPAHDQYTHGQQAAQNGRLAAVLHRKRRTGVFAIRITPRGLRGRKREHVHLSDA